MHDVSSDPSNIIAGNTTRFEFVDGSTEGLEFFQTASFLPWGNDQPDNGQIDDDDLDEDSLDEDNLDEEPEPELCVA